MLFGTHRKDAHCQYLFTVFLMSLILYHTSFWKNKYFKLFSGFLCSLFTFAHLMSYTLLLTSFIENCLQGPEQIY